MSRLQKYIQIKKDPTMATLKYFEQIESMAKNIIEKHVDNSIEQTKEKFEKDLKTFVLEIKKELNPLVKQLVGEIKQYVHSHPELFKGESIKGKDGKTPSKDELEQIIKPLIPKPLKGENGKTPIAELDYPSERQIKQMMEKMFSNITIDYKKTTQEILKKIKIPTYNEIARGIESLPKKEKLDYHKGLKNTPTETSNNSNQPTFRGGGMGNVETQSTNLSSSTTTINLLHNISSNGKAIWFNYQGQQQQLGVHFTVSGKTITLLFTPDDNTVADIIYIRK